MDNNGKKQLKTDWNKKGLGWIPDYPDLRDYDLEDEEKIKNKLRFKIEERTRNFEKVIEDLLDLFSNSILPTSSEQNRINEFKNKIFGNIFFAKVKIHKLLRYISKDDIPENEYINSQYPANEIKYESILSQQIGELKKYLGVLVMKRYLSEIKLQDTNTENFVDFCKPDKIVDWMRKQEYDLTTKLLVKDFQCRSQILPDGIVGLETYTTINEYFSDAEKLSTLTNYVKLPPGSTDKRSLSKIKSFAVTSLISKTEFEIILNIFKYKVIEQISKECQEYLYNPYKIPRIKERIFEYDFLKNLDVSRFKLFQEILGFSETDIENKEYFIQIKDYINGVIDGSDRKKCFLPQSSEIITVLQNSSVAEPIFSVVTRILSPLSQWGNQTWEELIEQGFEEFEKIANQESISDNSNIEPGYSKQELVRSAIFQVISLLRQEIYSLIEQKEEIEQCTIFVYFLLKKYLNRFVTHTSDAEKEIREAINQSQELKSNIFDKQEVFEVELIVNYNDNSTTSNNEQIKVAELFPHLDLHIPIVISNNYLKDLTTKKLDKKLFFQLPAVIDLSFWCSPVRDQGSLNSCTAFAAIALLEYFENRNFGKSTNASPLFIYKNARQKMNVQGDVGASIRETIKVLALFGVPPEESWPYIEEKVDEEPPPYCYAYAQNYKTLKYFLLDYAGITTESLLFQVKAVLAAGFPCIFGLTLYTSVYEETNSKKGYIPYPDANKDKVVGGHTAVVVGYDDYKFIRCANRQHYSRGAFLIRNSWGSEWGVNGYGWLPYDYVLAGLTSAWWSLLKAEWFDESNFGSRGSGGESGPSGKPD